MATTATVNPLNGPPLNRGHKVMLKIHQIARMRVRGMKDAQIAQHFQLSPQGMARLVASDEYKEVENQVLNGVITAWDQTLGADINQMRHAYKSTLPVALQALVDAALQQRDVKASIEAAKEILDRDPDKNFTKEKVVEGFGGRTIPQGLVDQMGKECDEIAKSL